MCETKIQQKFIAKKKKTRLRHEKLPKIGVEQIENHGKFYLYLYLLDT
jgi:hypothetical protein